MKPTSIKLARAIIAAKKRNETETAVREIALSFGVPDASATEAVEVVLNGFKHGVQSAVTMGMSSKDLKLGENELFDAGYGLGRKEMRWTSGWPLLLKLAFPIVLGIGLLVFLVYKFVF